MSQIAISHFISRRSSATADGPRDALCQSRSYQLLHNRRNKLYSESTTNRSNRVRGLATCSKQPRLVDCRIGVVNMLDRRRVLLTTPSACRGTMFKSKVSEGNTLILEIPEFPYKHSLGQTKGSSRAKNQLIPSSRFDTILACDRQKDG